MQSTIFRTQLYRGLRIEKEERNIHRARARGIISFFFTGVIVLRWYRGVIGVAAAGAGPFDKQTYIRLGA